VPKKIGLPDSFKMRHDTHFVELLSSISKSPLLRVIPIEKIYPNPNQPRSELGNIDDLALSIKSKGILEPIIVRPKGEGYEIISGERRYRAAIKAGLKEVPCIEMNVDDKESLEISLIENLHRKDLDPFEEADGLRALVEIYGYTHQEIAKKIGKSRISITETLSLLKIPEEVRKLCSEYNIKAKTVLVQIARQPSKEKMIELVERIKKEGLTREDTRKLTKQLKVDKEKKVEKPKNYIFKFRPPGKEYQLSIVFRKSSVEKSEIIEILKTIIRQLESES
jgi:ParB family chromosome partitioning protein